MIRLALYFGVTYDIFSTVFGVTYDTFCTDYMIIYCFTLYMLRELKRN